MTTITNGAVAKSDIIITFMQGWRDRIKAEDKIAAAVEDARDAGVTWDELAEPIGVTGRELWDWLDFVDDGDGPEPLDEWLEPAAVVSLRPLA